MEAAADGGACLNCGSELSGRFCARCGQRAVALRRGFVLAAMGVIALVTLRRLG